MPHGLTKFSAQDLAGKAEGGLKLLEGMADGDAASSASLDALQETMRIVLENQIAIVETLDLIKKEFDKFEEGLGKIL